jgi:bis(5'-nucleosidyl)-tetraphosphatase
MTERYSAGIIPVRFKVAKLPQLLMLRVYNLWDFPKGMLEEGEDHITAAKREIEEETTLIDYAFHWGFEYIDTGPYSQGKISRYFIAECAAGKVSLPVNPQLGRPEHHDFRWMNVHEARSLVRPRLIPVIDWIEEKLELEI